MQVVGSHFLSRFLKFEFSWLSLISLFFKKKFCLSNLNNIYTIFILRQTWFFFISVVLLFNTSKFWAKIKTNKFYSSFVTKCGKLLARQFTLNDFIRIRII
jgi:hypothetical protein